MATLLKASTTSGTTTCMVTSTDPKNDILVLKVVEEEEENKERFEPELEARVRQMEKEMKRDKINVKEWHDKIQKCEESYRFEFEPKCYYKNCKEVPKVNKKLFEHDVYFCRCHRIEIAKEFKKKCKKRKCYDENAKEIVDLLTNNTDKKLLEKSKESKLPSNYFARLFAYFQYQMYCVCKQLMTTEASLPEYWELKARYIELREQAKSLIVLRKMMNPLNLAVVKEAIKNYVNLRILGGIILFVVVSSVLVIKLFHFSFRAKGATSTQNSESQSEVLINASDDEKKNIDEVSQESQPKSRSGSISGSRSHENILKTIDTMQKELVACGSRIYDNQTNLEILKMNEDPTDSGEYNNVAINIERINHTLKQRKRASLEKSLEKGKKDRDTLTEELKKLFPEWKPPLTPEQEERAFKKMQELKKAHFQENSNTVFTMVYKDEIKYENSLIDSHEFKPEFNAFDDTKVLFIKTDRGVVGKENFYDICESVCRDILNFDQNFVGESKNAFEKKGWKVNIFVHNSPYSRWKCGCSMHWCEHVGSQKVHIWL
ncbi:hypothetical protein RFI_34507 [Reticulomyxa filosa]|uniref:Uncharacterized protein n=1 Tax=Reticulomyxa filosa TaxID=46433 RepID=X6LP56_RETFI|nr:hypothetical protein RFI_34507 [Reticulomyxa filosa]|eukprot:ETO02907.1 hypothetical protein RFI_34507 [Reticulomyxa filosa]